MTSDRTMTGTPGSQDLDQRLAALFEAFDVRSYSGAMGCALAGEYVGTATFHVFAGQCSRGAESRFWQAAAEVERVTATALEQLMAQRRMRPPDRSTFEAAGKMIGHRFSRHRIPDYCLWVEPQISAALDLFISLRQRSEYKHDSGTIELLIAHEQAFKDAWDCLDAGFEASCAPLHQFVARKAAPL